MTRVVDLVGPAVVRVELHGGRNGVSGFGSGVIISPDGLLLTNSHVVQGAREAQLVLARQPQGRARVLGDDPDTDLALLRAETDGLPFARWAIRAACKRGQMAIAIGNPFGFEFDRDGRRVSARWAVRCDRQAAA